MCVYITRTNQHNAQHLWITGTQNDAIYQGRHGGGAKTSRCAQLEHSNPFRSGFHSCCNGGSARRVWFPSTVKRCFQRRISCSSRSATAQCCWKFCSRGLFGANPRQVRNKMEPGTLLKKAGDQPAQGHPHAKNMQAHRLAPCGTSRQLQKVKQRKPPSLSWRAHAIIDKVSIA